MAKTLKLFTQLIAISAIICTIAGVMIYVSSENYMRKYELTLAESFENQVFGTISQSIAAEEKRLGDLGGNNAHWADFQRHMVLNDRAWIEKNATKYLNDDKAYDVDEIYIYDIGSKYKEKVGILPQSTFDEIIRNTDFSSLDKRNKNYFVGYNGKAFLLSVMAITDDDYNNASGYYILGTEMKSTLLFRIESYYVDMAKFEINLNESADRMIVLEDTFARVNVEEVLKPEEISRVFFRVEVTRNYLAEDARENTNSILLIGLVVGSISVFLLWIYYYRVGKNISTSIKAIKDISYNNYSKQVDLSFSKDFEELGKCINNLSKGLGTRDNEIELHYIGIITVLIKALEEVDKYTKGHSERVSHYAVEIAEAIGFEDVETIRISGLLHDVGKITIDTSILNKPGELTEVEFDIIKEHPVVAYNILNMSEIFSESKYIVRHHHERFDGRGYPDNLEGEEIPMGSRIIAIADVFDALTSRRSYRKRLDFKEAIAIMDKEAGENFDTEIYRVFKELAERIYSKWSDLQESPSVEEIVEKKHAGIQP